MSGRLQRWLDWREMVISATYSATGAEFLRNACPAFPQRTAYLIDNRATRVWWSDGAIEDIDDIDRLPKHAL